mgnify:CR=1 FL=1
MLLAMLLAVFLSSAPHDFSREGFYSLDPFSSMTGIASAENYKPDNYDNKITRDSLWVVIPYLRLLLKAQPDRFSTPDDKFTSTQARAPPQS